MQTVIKMYGQIKKIVTGKINEIGPIYCIIAILIPFVLCTVWFENNQLLMAAEEGPIFYNPAHTAQLYGHIWSESGIGTANPLIMPRIPFYLAVSYISYVLAPVIIQKILFYLLLVVPLFSLPSLVKLHFSKQDLAAKSAAVFYLFNIYVQSQVFNRFLYPQIFLWSYLPLFLLLFSQWLKTKKIKYLAYLIITSFMYSLTFSFITSVLVLWIPAAIITLISFTKNKQETLKLIVAAITALIIWLVFNSWWLLPLAIIKDNNYASALDPQKNVLSVIEVTKFFPNQSVALLKQQYFFDKYPQWLTISYFDQALFIIFFIMIFGVIIQLKRRSGIMFSIILLIGWFVSKGTNPPFGIEFFTNLFSYIPVTQVFRNPYEKFGLVFLLAYAVFFGLGVSKIFRNNKTAISIALVLTSTILVKPIWNGEIFAGYAATVPADYKIINEQISTDEYHRSISMPFLNTANVNYKWGYNGEELSELLIVKPTLSRTYNTPGDIYPLLYQYMRKPEFSNIFPILAIDHIILHHDIVKHSGYQETIDEAKNFIENWKDISLVKKTENISLYKYNKPINWGYVAKKVHKVSNQQEGLDNVISQQISSLNEAFSIDYIELNSDSLPEYTLTRITPETYKLNIKNAEENYAFILANTYNSNWLLESDGKPVGKHFKANGYSNAWIIDQKGSYEIIVSFKPFK